MRGVFSGETLSPTIESGLSFVRREPCNLSPDRSRADGRRRRRIEHHRNPGLRAKSRVYGASCVHRNLKLAKHHSRRANQICMPRRSVAGVTLPFAPGTTTMLFSPFAATKIGARPDGPANRATASVPTPALVKFSSSACPKHPRQPRPPFRPDSQAAPRHSLVRALAAGSGGEARADQRFAGKGDTRRSRHQIHVDAADNDDGLFAASFIRSHVSIKRRQRHGSKPQQEKDKHEHQKQSAPSAEHRQTRATQRRPSMPRPWSHPGRWSRRRPVQPCALPRPRNSRPRPAHQIAPPRMPARCQPRAHPVAPTVHAWLAVERLRHQQQVRRHGGEQHADWRRKRDRVRAGRLDFHAARHGVGHQRIETSHQEPRHEAQHDAARRCGFGGRLSRLR